ncbi:hypothetical protein H9L12_07260 [Sphingomonas rhizophila]|uniref:Uncharacterized protein n=1 Tax=Sphingomonas rhizophila TaxID=2071607 RepID=A0A7G9S8K2_9SPHN|nr:hypothetical protein [Sphingomonas rhizophila]QNN64177.1 hypothetical protein H9L12_07260 [Sphingomonas rhizophila]
MLEKLRGSVEDGHASGRTRNMMLEGGADITQDFVQGRPLANLPKDSKRTE